MPDPKWRSHCYRCGRFVPWENADIVYLADMGCYEEGYPECPPDKGCNASRHAELPEAGGHG